MSLIRIDIPKGVQDGQTSVSSQSPRSNVAQSPPMSMGSKIAIGYGLLAARTTYQTVTQELRAGGNEELATTLENISGAVAFGAATIATGGLSLIPAGVSEAAATISRSRGLARENRDIEFRREQMGRRVTFNQGRAYE